MLWAFETSIGHCARPTGFGEFALTSDANGVARFRAPLSKLFLTAKYFDATTKEQGQGESLEADREHIFRKLWEKTRAPERTFVFRVRRPGGEPTAAEVIIQGAWDLDGCSNPVKSLGATNEAGDLSAKFSEDDVESILIDGNYDAETYNLTPEEIAQLFRQSDITVIWPPKPK